MIHGSNVAGSGGRSYTPITGLGVFIPKIVNPSNAEYEKLTGRSLPFALTYEKKDNRGVMQKPLRILGHNPDKDVWEFIRFDISTTEMSFSNGTTRRYIDHLGRYTYPISALEDLSSKWNLDRTTARGAMTGEINLYAFLQALTRYSPMNEAADWMKDITAAKCDIATLFSGDMSGLQTLIEWANDQNMSAAVLYCVSTKDKGEGKIYYNQEIENKDAFFFQTEFKNEQHIVRPSSFTKFKSEYEGQIARSYNPTLKLFTYGLQDFKLEDCINYKPIESGSRADDGFIDSLAMGDEDITKLF